MGAYIKAKTRLTMNCSARMCGFASNMNRHDVVVLFCTFFFVRAQYLEKDEIEVVLLPTKWNGKISKVL